jgi:hypothetical protein
VSEHTVKAQIKSILSKLGANDRAHAVTLARDRGFWTSWLRSLEAFDVEPAKLLEASSKAALAGNDHLDLCSALYIRSRLKGQRAAISPHDAQRCEAELPARRLVRRSNRADA